MLNAKFSEETRLGIIFVLSLFALFLLMFVLNYFLGGSVSVSDEKKKEKTVIITQPKQSVLQAPSKSVVSTVRDAIKQGSFSTAYMEINKVPQNSPEYEELRKIIADETQKRKAPGIRKEAGASASTPIRYFDETTPRDRSNDAIYIYFVDISGTLWPRFCIQVAAKRPLGITGFTIASDTKNIKIDATSVKLENTEKGVAEWYDVPLDQRGYEVVQAIIKAKKSTLSIIGSSGKHSSRDVTDNEKKGFRNVLEGYTALGGNLNYMQVSKPVPSAAAKKSP